MREQLELIKQNALAALDAADSPAALEELRVKLLGKKGELTAVLRGMGALTPEERPIVGQMAKAKDKSGEMRWYLVTEDSETRYGCKDQLYGRKSCMPENLFEKPEVKK